LLRSKTFLAPALTVDTLGQDEPDEGVLPEARHDALAAVALLEGIGWEPASSSDGYSLRMPREQVSTFVARRGEVHGAESLDWSTPISDDVDDPDVLAERRAATGKRVNDRAARRRPR
jgi:hypothetical protein